MIWSRQHSGFLYPLVDIAASPSVLPNNAMQLTKLRAAPVLQAEVPPCAPAGGTDGVTASQLIASVRPTMGRFSTWEPPRAWPRRAV
jgi:hypothetical protein